MQEKAWIFNYDSFTDLLFGKEERIGSYLYLNKNIGGYSTPSQTASDIVKFWELVCVGVFYEYLFEGKNVYITVIFSILDLKENSCCKTFYQTKIFRMFVELKFSFYILMLLWRPCPLTFKIFHRLSWVSDTGKILK